MKHRILIAVALLVVILSMLAAPAAATERVLVNLLDNPGFDSNPVRAVDISPWVVIDGNGDKGKCAAVRAAPLPNSLPCMFVLKGGPTPTTLQQTLSSTRLAEINGVTFCEEAHLLAQFYLYANAAPDVQNIVKVKYSANATLYSTKSIETVVPLLDTWSSVGDADVYLPVGALVSKVVYQIRHRDSGGKVYVDDAQLFFSHAGALC